MRITKSKVKNFLFGMMLGIPISIAAFQAWNHPAQAQNIDFDDYVQEPDAEEQALGIEYESAKDYTETIETTVPGFYSEGMKELHIEATAYCYGEITKSGKEVREGHCAMKEEWIGLTAIVYEDAEDTPGELIGIYEVEDTGGDYRIQNGTCIDIYMQDYTEAIEFGRQDVIVYLVDAKG